jgi:hypothetical protein
MLQSTTERSSRLTPVGNVASSSSAGQSTVLDDLDTAHSRLGDFSFLLSWPTQYQEIIEMSWSKLLFGFALTMVSAMIVFGFVYYGMCVSCGARNCDATGALMMSWMMVGGNGAFTGEDDVMVTWGTTCFPWRTLFIAAAGMCGMAIMALGTAAVIGKAARHTSLRDRIAFAPKAVARRLRPPMDGSVNSSIVSSVGSGPLSSLFAVEREETVPPAVLQIRVSHVHSRPLLNANVTLTAVLVRPAGEASSDTLLQDSSRVTLSLQNLHVVALESHSDSDADQRGAVLTRIRGQSKQPIPMPVNMWYPVVITHWLDDPKSPLASHFKGAAELRSAMQQNDVQFVCEVSGTDPLNGATVLARKTFHSANIQFGFRYSDAALLKSAVLSDARRHVHVDLEALGDVLPDDEGEM